MIFTEYPETSLYFFESAGFVDHEKIEMEVRELFELVLGTKFFFGRKSRVC